MRIYTIKYGKYAGEHKIFMDNEEAIKYLTEEPELNINKQPLDKFKIWYDESNKAGDWVRSDDGRIIQLFIIYVLKRKNKKGTYVTIGNIDQVTKTYKFCTGIYTKYYRLNDGNPEWAPQRMTVDARSFDDYRHNKVSITKNTYVFGKYLTVKKRLFAYYCAIYGNPITAFCLVAGEIKLKKTRYSQILRQAFSLLKEECVLEEIKTYMSIETFKSKLKKSMEDAKFGVPEIVAEFITGITSAKPGSLNHATFTKMGFELMKYIEETEADGVDPKKSINGTKYELLPSPKAEIMSKVSPQVTDFVQNKNTEFLSSDSPISGS